ncbi:hypothetical protein ACKI2N_032770 [Cupriavidus sp. 30B13]|uniref:hypothetical protein n=1 Tax=Cupriavidus sp. 30B13 TaxID=3384241 RepID=UPI003B922210
MKHTGLRIVRALKQIPGCTCVTGFDHHGRPVYSGNTEVWWDGQKTERYNRNPFRSWSAKAWGLKLIA